MKRKRNAQREIPSKIKKNENQERKNRADKTRRYT